MPAADGLNLVYVLCDEWMWRRDLLVVMGAEDPNRLDTALAEATPRTRGAERRAQIAEMVTAMGGDVGGG
jgi:hypothetical protein